MIADSAKEAEDHRAKMTELNNRIDYYDLVMQEREEEYQKMLHDAERQAQNINDPSEEIKEAEKKRQQELIEAFDKLMHSFGVWDVEELVSRFLQKEEKMVLTQNYLNALEIDKQNIESDIDKYDREAKRLKLKAPEEDEAVVSLKTKIESIESKNTLFRSQTERSVRMLDNLIAGLASIKERMGTCTILSAMRPVRRRWALLRANISRVPLIASTPERKTGQGAKVVAKFDPRRKTIIEEFTEADVPAHGLEALLDIAVVEHYTMVLLGKAQVGAQAGQDNLLALTRPIQRTEEDELPLPLPLVVEEEAQKATLDAKGRRRKGRESKPTTASTAGLESPKTAPIVRPVPTPLLIPETTKTEKIQGKDDKPDLGLFPGPREAIADVRKGRAQAHVIPTLKEIESPRELEALSPSEIRRQVAEGGHSEKVAERLRRFQAGQNRQAKNGAMTHSPMKTGMSMKAGMDSFLSP